MTLSSNDHNPASTDLAKMLQAVGVDSVVSVDLQRPGQGHEACFFDSQIPVETISTNSVFAEYFRDNIDPPLKKVGGLLFVCVCGCLCVSECVCVYKCLCGYLFVDVCICVCAHVCVTVCVSLTHSLFYCPSPPLLHPQVVIVSANTECVKKARKFQRKLKEITGLEDVEYAVFMRGKTRLSASFRDLSAVFSDLSVAYDVCMMCVWELIYGHQLVSVGGRWLSVRRI